MVNAWRTVADYAGAPHAPLAVSAARVVELSEASQLALRHIVDDMRADGWTWAEVGDALGVSAQAAHHRYRTVTE
jgi:hypothetical protein